MSVVPVTEALKVSCSVVLNENSLHIVIASNRVESFHKTLYDLGQIISLEIVTERHPPAVLESRECNIYFCPMIYKHSRRLTKET